MNREILFKAKRIDNGEWVDGALLQSEDASYIATSFLCENPDTPLTVAAYEVDPDTICQYTGLMDKNGELKDKPTISKMENVDWIPVEERLPEKGEIVLVTIECDCGKTLFTNGVMFGFYKKGWFVSDDIE